MEREKMKQCYYSSISIGKYNVSVNNLVQIHEINFAKTWVSYIDLQDYTHCLEILYRIKQNDPFSLTYFNFKNHNFHRFVCVGVCVGGSGG